MFKNLTLTKTQFPKIADDAFTTNSPPKVSNFFNSDFDFTIASFTFQILYFTLLTTLTKIFKTIKVSYSGTYSTAYYIYLPNNYSITFHNSLI